MRRAAPFVLALAVVAVVVIGLLQARKEESTDLRALTRTEAYAGLDGAPAPLAALHDQGGQLLGGGTKAFRARLAELRGHPVVINKWAHWCGPCTAEFPVFQRVAAAKGKEVAFLGIDAGDSADEARKFLARYPVSYPSFSDPKEQIARSVEAPAAYPITIFVDRDGEVVIPHSGGYDSVEELEADIKRYLRA